MICIFHSLRWFGNTVRYSSPTLKYIHRSGPQTWAVSETTLSPSFQGTLPIYVLAQLNFQSAPFALKIALVCMTNYTFPLVRGPWLKTTLLLFHNANLKRSIRNPFPPLSSATLKNKMKCLPISSVNISYMFWLSHFPDQWNGKARVYSAGWNTPIYL